MTATATLTAPNTAGLAAASALQNLLPPLVAFTQDAKQAHWNVTGPAFLALHALTDEIAADTRAWVDRVAERAAALGFAVDARPGTVAAAVTGTFPAGRLSDHETITELAVRLDDLAATSRRSLTALDDSDVVAHDIIVDILEGLEKYRWMLRAQVS